MQRHEARIYSPVRGDAKLSRIEGSVVPIDIDDAAVEAAANGGSDEAAQRTARGSCS